MFDDTGLGEAMSRSMNNDKTKALEVRLAVIEKQFLELLILVNRLAVVVENK